MGILYTSYLTVWAAWQLARTMRRAAAGTQAALAKPESLPHQPLSAAKHADIRQRAAALHRISRLWPSRIQCAERSFALWDWVHRQGLQPTMEVGWRGREAHAWVRIGQLVLNDRQNIGEDWVSLRPDAQNTQRALNMQQRLTQLPAWWALATAAVRSSLTRTTDPGEDVIISDLPGFFSAVDHWEVGAAVDSFLLTRETRLPAAIVEQLQRRMSRRNAMYTAALSELVDLATRFRHAAVPYVYLKGFSISAAAAADPLAREMADLDFLVPADDLQSAHKILAERDYVPNEPVEKVGFRRLATMTHHEAVYCSPSAVLPVELHWRLSEVRFMRSLNVGLFHLHKTERMIAGNPVTTLSNAAMTLLCALHGARHFWFRLKWVADFAALISILSDADQEELISISKQAGCLHVVSAGIELTQDLLGIDMPPFTSALLKERDTKRDELAAIWLRMCQPGPNGRPRDPATIKRAIRLTSPGLSTRIRWRFFEWVSPDFPLVEAFPHAETRLQVPTAKLRRRFRRFNLLNRSSDPAPDFQALQEDLPRNGDKSAA